MRKTHSAAILAYSERFLAGMHAVAIAKEVGCHRSCVHRAFQVAGVERPYSDLKARVLAFAEQYAAGMPIKEIAAQVGAAPESCRSYLNMCGIKRARRAVRALPKTAEMIAYIRMGGKPSRLARAAGVKLPAVYRRLACDGFRLYRGVVEHDYLGGKRGTLAQRVNRVADIENQVDRLIAEHKAEVAARRMAA